MGSPFAIESRRYSNLVKQEQWPEHGYCRDVVTVNESTAQSYVVGTALGKVTATGKYKISKADATDGSEVVAALVLGEYAVAGSTDTKVLALVRGQAIVSKFGIQLDATYNLQAEKDAAYAALEAKGILCNDSV